MSCCCACGSSNSASSHNIHQALVGAAASSGGCKACITLGLWLRQLGTWVWWATAALGAAALGSCLQGPYPQLVRTLGVRANMPGAVVLLQVMTAGHSMFPP